MRQSSIIFGTILFAFVIYITLRGQLPAYLALFSGKDVPAPASSNSGGNGNSSGSVMNSIENIFNDFQGMFE